MTPPTGSSSDFYIRLNALFSLRWTEQSTFQTMCVSLLTWLDLDGTCGETELGNENSWETLSTPFPSGA
jgi:hypothetical protein